jgi:hypothetical protein
MASAAGENPAILIYPDTYIKKVESRGSIGVNPFDERQVSITESEHFILIVV